MAEFRQPCAIPTLRLHPAPNQAFSFEWDGRDAYGRALQGTQPATVRLGYVYDAVYAVLAAGGVVAWVLYRWFSS